MCKHEKGCNPEPWENDCKCGLLQETRKRLIRQGSKRMAEDRIMTDEQLMELHNDIRDGVTATITVKHLHDRDNALWEEFNAFKDSTLMSSLNDRQMNALDKITKLVPAKDRPPPPKNEKYNPKDYPLKQKGAINEN